MRYTAKKLDSVSSCKIHFSSDGRTEEEIKEDFFDKMYYSNLDTFLDIENANWKIEKA